MKNAAYVDNSYSLMGRLMNRRQISPLARNMPPPSLPGGDFAD
jgi:hypothetical protein